MSENKSNKSIEFKTVDDEKGSVEAVFSVYNTLDTDGDVVIPGAIKSGFKNNQVPMVFAHKWDQPIGKGVIDTDDDKATFRGSFFMETEAGKEAYNLAKEMGDLQEWSFGFRINDYEVAPFQKDGQDEVDVRYLKDLEVFEVSPVLVGANRETYTLAIKSGEEAVYESNNLEEEKAALARDMFDNPGEAMNRSKELSCAVGVHTETMDGKEVFMPCKTHAEYEEAIKDEKKDLDSEENTDEVLEENQEKVSEEESLPTGKRFSEEVKDVLAALESLIVRAKAIEVLRSKDGRTLSERASSALRAVQEDLNDAWTEIDDILGDATSEVEGATEETVEDNPVEETQGSTVTETEEAVEPEIDEDAEIEESEVEVEDVIEVEEEEAETEEVLLEEVDEEIEALFAESQGLIADSILVELDDEEV
jgi:HK97 family phage prohead protease